MSDSNYATQAGTARYAARFAAQMPGHFRTRYGLQMSSLGIGTYLGDADPETSAGYVASIQTAVRHGCNVIDTAINYRMMQSERDVGRALRALFDAGECARDEILVCTKGGFVPFDGQPSLDRQADLQARFLDTGLAEPMDIVGSMHCIAPDYLSNQLDISLANLGLDAVDVYYLHNPEVQLDYITPTEFERRMRAAFARLEQEAANGRIRFYGVATWDGLRAVETDPLYVPLHWLMRLAREVGGERHRFRFVQFPYNVGMIDPLVEYNQWVEKSTAEGERERIHLQLLAACVQHGLVAISSASLGQTQALSAVPDRLKARLDGHAPGTLQSDAQYALQFNRSTPGLTTSLVGMHTPDHVVENLAVARQEPLSPQAFLRTFRLPDPSHPQ